MLWKRKVGEGGFGGGGWELRGDKKSRISLPQLMEIRYVFLLQYKFIYFCLNKMGDF